MEFSISELKDELERSRYVEKYRIRQTFETIGGPWKLGRILQNMAYGAIQETLLDMGKPIESFYIDAAQ